MTYPDKCLILGAIKLKLDEQTFPFFKSPHKFCVGNAGQSGAIKLTDGAVEKEMKHLLHHSKYIILTGENISLNLLPHAAVMSNMRQTSKLTLPCFDSKE